MTAYLVRRVLRAFITLWVTVTALFFLLRLNVDIGQLALPVDASAEAIAAFNERWGYDRSYWEQYLAFLRGLLQGDFGFSFRDSRPAIDWVAERLPKTLQLSVAGFALMVALGVTAGIAAALRRGSPVDTVIMAAAVTGFSVPSFVLGLGLIYVFAVALPLLPSSGSGTWAHLILPAATYGVVGAAGIARFTRSAMLDVLGRAYITAAQAAGAPPREVILRHAAPNAAIPVVTMLGFSVGQLVGGSIIVETIFAWPGLGQALYNAVTVRDLAVVQLIVMIFVLFMVIANLVVDLLYGALNPKIRRSGHGPRG